MDKYLFIALTLVLTVYAQLIVKARSFLHAVPHPGAGRLDYLIAMYTDPAVLSGFAAGVIASVTWALALEKAGLGFAYPFMALSFVLVPLGARALFGEAVSPLQLVGLALIVAGVAVNASAYRS